MIPASGEFGDYILESVAEKLLDGIRNGITCDHFLQSPVSSNPRRSTLAPPPVGAVELRTTLALRLVLHTAHITEVLQIKKKNTMG